MSKKKGSKARGLPAQIIKAVALDAFRNNKDNDWSYLDNKNLNESLTRDARGKIRNRARYETLNNPYAFGTALTVCNSVCPSVPHIQLSSSEVESAFLNEIEDDFYAWCLAVRLDEKVRALRFAKLQDGEGFAVLHDNENLREEDVPVHLDFTPIDCSRVRAARFDDTLDPLNMDGVEIDEWGSPKQYTVFNGTEAASLDDTFKVYPASRVLHWFRRSTPEQYRGVSELAPALLTLAYLRRYSYATVRGAELAANIALLLKTDAIDAGITSKDGSAFLEAKNSLGTGLILPSGFEASQLKPEQPTNNYGMMIDELLGSVGSSIGVPRLIIRKSAGGFTYASAKVDLSEMERFISIERSELVRSILNRIFNAWFKEYCLVTGTTPFRKTVVWTFEEGLGVKIDPLKEANATAKRFDYNITTLAREYAAQGLDWQKELEQKAKEAAYIKELEEKYDVTLTEKAAAETREPAADLGEEDAQ